MSLQFLHNQCGISNVRNSCRNVVSMSSSLFSFLVGSLNQLVFKIVVDICNYGINHHIFLPCGAHTYIFHLCCRCLRCYLKLSSFLRWLRNSFNIYNNAEIDSNFQALLEFLYLLTCWLVIWILAVLGNYHTHSDEIYKKRKKRGTRWGPVNIKINLYIVCSECTVVLSTYYI